MSIFLVEIKSFAVFHLFTNIEKRFSYPFLDNEISKFKLTFHLSTDRHIFCCFYLPSKPSNLVLRRGHLFGTV